MKTKVNKYINKALQQNHHNIYIAKANGFEAIMLPVEKDFDPIEINNIDDMDYMIDVAQESGWEMFVIYNLENQSKVLIDLHTLQYAA
ncbi:MAG: hypothetical protein IE909_03225 [Campylobacterales bacterium]|nr:hypothetical protein [Campylobacterales bacterium]